MASNSCLDACWERPAAAVKRISVVLLTDLDDLWRLHVYDGMRVVSRIDVIAMSSSRLRFVDVGVTATAKEFAGTYRGKQYHPPDFTSTLERANHAGVKKVLLTGMYVNDIAVNFKIVQSNVKQCHMTAGVHPYHASELENETTGKLEDLKRSINGVLDGFPGSIAAFGELGLDFDRTNHASEEVQRHAFQTQLDLIVDQRWDLPLFLHCRAAFEPFIEIITPYLAHLPRKGLVHSFVGTTEEMQKLIDLGLDISVNGFSFQTPESLEMVRNLPLDRLHLETDAPWGWLKNTSDLVSRYCKDAPPLPANKKKENWDGVAMIKDRNESCMISRIAFIVAGLKGLRVEEVAEAAWRNSIRLFRMPVDDV